MILASSITTISEQRLGEPKIAWLGNANNILYFCRQIRELMKVCGQSSSTFQLDVLSNQPALDMAKSAFDSAVTSARRSWTLRLIPWDMAAQPLQLEEVLGPAHVAWLPSDPQNIIKAGVSHNRLVDSVRSGCIPLASPMVSYLELRKLALIGTDHNHILESLITNYPRLSVKYSGLRHNLLSRFEPSVNLRNWEDSRGSRIKRPIAGAVPFMLPVYCIARPLSVNLCFRNTYVALCRLSICPMLKAKISFCLGKAAYSDSKPRVGICL